MTQTTQEELITLVPAAHYWQGMGVATIQLHFLALLTIAMQLRDLNFSVHLALPPHGLDHLHYLRHSSTTCTRPELTVSTSRLYDLDHLRAATGLNVTEFNQASGLDWLAHCSKHHLSSAADVDKVALNLRSRQRKQGEHCVVLDTFPAFGAVTDHKQRLSLVAALRPSKRLQVTVRLLWRTLVHHGEVHAVYVRSQDDWAHMCGNMGLIDNDTDASLCFHTAKAYPLRISELGFDKRTPVLVLGPSSADHSVLGHFQSIGYQTLSKETVLPSWRNSYGTWSQHDMAVIEMELASKASLFIAPVLSTFGQLVRESRAASVKALPSFTMEKLPLCQGVAGLCATCRHLFWTGCNNAKGDFRRCLQTTLHKAKSHEASQPQISITVNQLSVYRPEFVNEGCDVNCLQQIAHVTDTLRPSSRYYLPSVLSATDIQLLLQVYHNATKGSQKAPVYEVQVAETHPVVLRVLNRVRQEIWQRYGKVVNTEIALVRNTYPSGMPFHGDQCWQTKGKPCIPHLHCPFRAWSLSLALNSDFHGGELEFSEPLRNFNLQAGDAILFSSGQNNQHRVRPIKRGSRFVLLMWFQTSLHGAAAQHYTRLLHSYHSDTGNQSQHRSDLFSAL